jgi:tetratricopeptide (TPR) repeat protein
MGLAPLLLLGVGMRAGAQGGGEGIAQYRAGEYRAAARSFEEVTRHTPAAVSAWRNLAAARWLDGDDIGASAAWVRALALAPRDPATRDAWHGSGGIPAEVRALAPTIPVSRDEMLVSALIAWWLGWIVLLLGARRAGVLLASVSLLFAGGALLRMRLESEHRVLLRSGAVLRVSPQTAAPSLGEGIAWSLARVEREREGWVLVTLVSGRQGWLPGSAVAPLGPLD